MKETKGSYRPLVSAGSHSDDDDVVSNEDQLPQGRSRRRMAIQSITTYVLLGINVMLVITLLALLPHRTTDAECTKRLSLYSPALDAVEYVNSDFVNDFNVTSIYRGPPTPEREEAWDKLTYKHGIEVPPSELPGLNRSESDNLKHVPSEVGPGYVAILEVFHQLHCLNMIRMYTWWQVDKYPGIPDGLSMSPLKNRMHIDHCIESLRISLQCASDVTPVLVRLGGPVGAKADFSSHHRCRNFDKIENWIDNNWTVN